MKKASISFVLTTVCSLFILSACSVSSNSKEASSSAALDNTQKPLITNHSLICYAPISSQKITFKLITASAEPISAPATLESESESVSLECKSHLQDPLSMKEIWRCADEPVRDIMNIVSVYHLNSDKIVAVIEQSPVFPEVTMECEPY